MTLTAWLVIVGVLALLFWYWNHNHTFAHRQAERREAERRQQQIIADGIRQARAEREDDE